jgi:DNA polymerase-3 subunit delta
MDVPRRYDDASLLEAALQEGFPPGHCLLLTADTVDKRRSLYRLIKEKGVVLDFGVVSGTSRQARSQQETVLKDVAQEALSEAGKEIEPAALALLLEATGFNLWALRRQIEKLISFAGDETRITVEHTDRMSGHLREEPLYELNNAVAARNCEASLRVLNRLLDQDYHPLQLLGSLANEIRRLLLAREFIDEHLAGSMDSKISYGRFQKSILPLVKEKIGKDSPLATLHPFALQKTMVRSSSFQKADLVRSMQHLFGADITLKSTSLPGRAVMESLILRLCRPKRRRHTDFIQPQ